MNGRRKPEGQRRTWTVPIDEGCGQRRRRAFFIGRKGEEFVSGPRAHRVAESIHKEVSALLIKGLKDPRIGFITITGVEVTPDLHLARIYFTVVGDDEQRRRTEDGLRSSVPFIRRELGRTLRMRYLPDLLFCYDTSLDYGNRIETLLKEIHDQERDDPENT